ncbi:hypothetical protein HS961_02075 [Comamonas piscis]|uniref:Uncharacterized protein n=1 Tax=Comamonas piscis TaxID=1562974 RepID=A0A7G5ECJ2_9BURK|nr:hypothetical protein [Comamonas piscis]QMV71717.1 hypothetical protein HS961_02075 [Comamonas piscis]WSO34440.1 hypothetical protein VUJ63_02090 [Comamonas piscis]
MRGLKEFLLCTALVATLAGCKVSVNTGSGSRLEGAGVVFIVPLQSAESQYGTGGINYRSDTITASTDGKHLIVNGKSYGSVQAGDVVDLSDVRVIKVNAQPRAPSVD